jgi:cell division protein FtsB
MTDNIAVKLIQKLQRENEQLQRENKKLSKELKHKKACIAVTHAHDDFILELLKRHEPDPDYFPKARKRVR